MKVSRLSLPAALFAAALLNPVSSFAADSATVEVNARLDKACKLTGTTSSIPLTLDVNKDESLGSGTLSLWCTKTTAYSFSITDATGFKLKHTDATVSTDEIDYTVDTPASGTGLGVGSTETRDLKVRVSKASFLSKAPGTYAGQFTVSVNF